MIQEYQLRVLPEVAANEQRLKEYLIHERTECRGDNSNAHLEAQYRCPPTDIYINLNVRAYLNEMPKGTNINIPYIIMKESPK